MRTARPNILWILSDELRSSALNCYGGSWARVWTPSIDRLAERGVLFTQNFCNAPVCVPSRVSMLTGASPERTGVYSNEGAWKSFPLPVLLPTFPELFAREGYTVASVGKTHHPVAYHPWPEDLAEGSGMHDFGLDTDPGPLQPIVPPGIPSPVGGVFPADRPFPPDGVTRNALRWLGAHAEETFLLRVSYLQPHTPVLPPEKYRAMYRAKDWPGHDLPQGYGSVYDDAFADVVGGRKLSHEQMQRAQADYHALVTWLDAQVGILLGALHLAGLAENTIVVFNSDHGASLGEDGLLSKVVFAPQSHRTPFIVSWPGHLPEGERRDSLSQNLDLAATLCDLTGVTPLQSFEGRSAFSAKPPPEMIFGTSGSGARGARASVAANKGGWRNGKGWPRRACVRTARYRLDMNVRQDDAFIAVEEEDIFLADTVGDPAEIRNLANEAVHGDVVRELRSAVLARAAGALEAERIPEFTPDEAPDFLPPKIKAD